MATVSQTTPYLCTSLLFMEDQAIKRAINTRDGYIKRYYHAKGEHARKIQRVLALYYELVVGYSVADSFDGTVDPPGKGVFGPAMEIDVYFYQNHFSLAGKLGHADGICGPKTLKHMDAYWRDNRPFHLGLDPRTGAAY